MAEHVHEWPKSILDGVPWPATCGYCMLTTEDPDAYFYPVDWDGDTGPPHDRLCPASPTSVHEPDFRCLACPTIQDAAQREAIG